MVVGNDIPTTDGPLGENDMHVDGEIWCQKFFKGGTWKQTSYNGNFEKIMVAKVLLTIPKRHVYQPSTFTAWTLDSNGDWQPPIAKPTIINDGQDPVVWEYLIVGMMINIKRDNTGWEATKSNDLEESRTVYNWNGTGWLAKVI